MQVHTLQPITQFCHAHLATWLGARRNLYNRYGLWAPLLRTRCKYSGILYGGVIATARVFPKHKQASDVPQKVEFIIFLIPKSSCEFLEFGNTHNIIVLTNFWPPMFFLTFFLTPIATPPILCIVPRLTSERAKMLCSGVRNTPHLSGTALQ